MELYPKNTGESPNKKVMLWLKITKAFPLDLHLSDTIASIKDQIYLIEETSVDQQKLYFAGTHLQEDAKSLADYNLSANSTLDVLVEGRIQISARIPSLDKTLTFNIRYMDTVQNLKLKIRDEVGLSLNQQLVVLCGKSLSDNQVLIAAGVRKHSRLYVMLNPTAELLLSIETSSGAFFSLNALMGYTIGDVKLALESLIGIPASRQKLFHDKVELSDSFSLSSGKILQRSIILLRVQMQIFVKIKTGNTITIDAEDSDTIGKIVFKVEEKAKLNCALRLLYGGKVLQERENLAFYGIQKGSELKCCLRTNVTTEEAEEVKEAEEEVEEEEAETAAAEEEEGETEAEEEDTEEEDEEDIEADEEDEEGERGKE